MDPHLPRGEAHGHSGENGLSSLLLPPLFQTQWGEQVHICLLAMCFPSSSPRALRHLFHEGLYSSVSSHSRFLPTLSETAPPATLCSVREKQFGPSPTLHHMAAFIVFFLQYNLSSEGRGCYKCPTPRTGDKVPQVLTKSVEQMNVHLFKAQSYWIRDDFSPRGKLAGKCSTG